MWRAVHKKWHIVAEQLHVDISIQLIKSLIECRSRNLAISFSIRQQSAGGDIIIAAGSLHSAALRNYRECWCCFRTSLGTSEWKLLLAPCAEIDMRWITPEKLADDFFLALVFWFLKISSKYGMEGLASVIYHIISVLMSVWFSAYK